jgi:hypothetical protein
MEHVGESCKCDEPICLFSALSTQGIGLMVAHYLLHEHIQQVVTKY